MERRHNVWGCIGSFCVGNLEFVESTMYKIGYLNLLKQNIREYAEKLAVSDDFSFQWLKGTKLMVHIVTCPKPITDEAHFWLNGYVNKQNCRIWSEANPQVYVETLLHPEKLTVWCALWAGGILLQKR
ncbi:hypothetical protein TNCV_398831 [Trichonephila clavipes]|uniref:Uncharacterized protein n=1 Tax=Trichonephila clavipes TaxID=2585209 RepID=A0A8X6VTV8_TRICX|nr:hypothetical protein TNCV_398831 [Trichonephila clavipes]